jgi:hypothetical protein
MTNCGQAEFERRLSFIKSTISSWENMEFAEHNEPDVSTRDEEPDVTTRRDSAFFLVFQAQTFITSGKTSSNYGDGHRRYDLSNTCETRMKTENDGELSDSSK